MRLRSDIARSPVSLVGPVVALMLLASAAAPSPPPPPPPPAPVAVPAPDVPTWFARMDALGAALADLYVQVLPPRPSWTPAATARVVADAKRIAELARTVHALEPGAAPDADPSISLMGSLFVEETKRLASSLERGDRVAHARDLARGVAAYCIGCHTRTARLATVRPAAQLPNLDKLDPVNRAELLIATHRFDDARVQLSSMLAQDRFAEHDEEGWQRAVTRALLLEVRTERSPEGALALVDRILNGPVPAERTWDDADGWRRALLAWPRETRSTSPALPPLADATRLMAQAAKAPRVPGDRGADVLYLRASAALHEHLATAPRGESTARAFSMLGIAYRHLRDVDVWTLSRLYDEGCIQELPHTALALSCFERYRDVVIADETGNGGGELPLEIKEHLEELGRLAAPALATPKHK